MKVLILITKSANLGGAQTYVRNLALHLKKLNHEVVVAGSKAGVLAEQLRSEAVRYRQIRFLRHSINPLLDVLALISIIFLIRREKPDIVSLNSSKIGILGRIACVTQNVPSVFTVHGWSFTEGISGRRAQIFKTVERLIKPFSDHWIVVSKFDLELGVRSGLLDQAKTKLIYNGTKKVVYDKEEKHEGSREDVVLTMTARHDTQKDHLTLFEAVKGIEGLRLWLIGDGPLLEHNKKTAERFGIGERVIFHGFHSNPIELLARSDIFALISNYEGFPISTLEAMSVGIPVIVSNVGGAGEAIIDGETGFLVERRNAMVLKDRIIKLLQDSELRVKMGRAGKKKAEELFTIEQCVDSTINFFMEVIADRSRQNRP